MNWYQYTDVTPTEVIVKKSGRIQLAEIETVGNVLHLQVPTFNADGEYSGSHIIELENEAELMSIGLEKF